MATRKNWPKKKRLNRVWAAPDPTAMIPPSVAVGQAIQTTSPRNETYAAWRKNEREERRFTRSSRDRTGLSLRIMGRIHHREHRGHREGREREREEKIRDFRKKGCRR